jgi:hypothetical protein
MLLEAGDFLGRVTFITGPGKHCGKTTLLNACLALLRGAGEAPAFLGVGFEGEGRDALSGLRKPRIACLPGEVFVTAERYLRETACRPELLDVLPGSTALGRLAIARAGRAGAVTLVGPERNEIAAFALSRIAEEGWARTVLVDGAINRITQVSSFPGARFLFALRVSPSELDRSVRRMRLAHALQALPVADAARMEGPVYELEGPLTDETVKKLPEGAKSVVVEDFTKIFLDASSLAAFRRGRGLYLRSGSDFGGFVVVLRDLSRRRFLAALGDPVLASLVAFNPYEGAGDAAMGGAA